MKGKFKIFSYLSGILIGAVNGLFGAGGGIIAVPILEKTGLNKTGDGLTQAKASKARTEALVAEGEKKCNDYLDKLKTPIEVYNEKNN